MSVKRILFFLILLGILAGVGFKVYSRAEAMKKSKGEKSQKQTQKIIPVEASAPAVKTMEEILYLTGDVRGLNVAGLFPKVPGKMMKKVKEVGDAVTKGETIALIDRDEPALKFAPAEVSAPLDGVITRYFVDLGQNITQTTQLCEIAEISKVKVVVYVTEKDLPKVKLGQSARFTNDAYPTTFPGTLSKISESLDLTTRSSEVEILAENPGNLLKPGMFARVQIVLGVHENALIIPKKAIEQSLENNFVYLIKENKAFRKQIMTGLVFEKEVEVISGLDAKDLLITVGWHNVSEGSEVEIVS